MSNPFKSSGVIPSLRNILAYSLRTCSPISISFCMDFRVKGFLILDTVVDAFFCFSLSVSRVLYLEYVVPSKSLGSSRSSLGTGASSSVGSGTGGGCPKNIHSSTYACVILIQRRYFPLGFCSLDHS